VGERTRKGWGREGGRSGDRKRKVKRRKRRRLGGIAKRMRRDGKGK
jgi:hypothetical protein